MAPTVPISSRTDQRRVPLNATLAGSNAYTLALPSDPGIVVPDYWMLFAMDANGTPASRRSS